jgi:hypothetical protein
VKTLLAVEEEEEIVASMGTPAAQFRFTVKVPKAVGAVYVDGRVSTGAKS